MKLPDVGGKPTKVKTDKRDNLKAVTRKKRSDAKTRVNPSLDNETHDLLERLALACRSGEPTLTKTGLAAKIIFIAMRDPALIRGLQDMYTVREEYRVRPLLDNGERKFNP